MVYFIRLYNFVAYTIAYPLRKVPPHIEMDDAVRFLEVVTVVKNDAPIKLKALYLSRL